MPQFQNIHVHNSNSNFTALNHNQTYGGIVGTLNVNTDFSTPTTTNGEHLIFNINAGTGVLYEVDLNIKDANGSYQGFYLAQEQDNGADPHTDPVQIGLIDNAQVDYKQLGITADDFIPTNDRSISNAVEKALDQAAFVAVYGIIYQDSDKQGIHDVHHNTRGTPNQDGALLVYTKADNNQFIRTWFFFKFQNDNTLV
ncbi:MAG: DUF2278 family protein [Methylomonas sp.]